MEGIKKIGLLSKAAPNQEHVLKKIISENLITNEMQTLLTTLTQSLHQI